MIPMLFSIVLTLKSHFLLMMTYSHVFVLQHHVFFVCTCSSMFSAQLGLGTLRRQSTKGLPRRDSCSCAWYRVTGSSARVPSVSLSYLWSLQCLRGLIKRDTCQCGSKLTFRPFLPPVSDYLHSSDDIHQTL